MKKIFKACSSRAVIFTAIGILYLFGGYQTGILGPTLIDLQIQSQSTTEQISFLFTSLAIGGIISCFLLGQLLRKIDDMFTIVIFCVLDTVVFAAIPFTKNILTLTILFGFAGVIDGMLKICQNKQVVLLWKDKASTAYSFTNALFSGGIMLAPVIAQPFVTTDIYHHLDLANRTDSENDTIINNNTCENCSVTDTVYRSNIIFPYLLPSAVFLGLFVYFLVIFFSTGCNVVQKRVMPTEKENDSITSASPKVEKIDSKTKRNWAKLLLAIIAYVFVFLYGFFYAGIEVVYSGLFPLFAVDFLKWSNTNAIWGLFAFQMSNFAFTVLGIGITLMISSGKILFAELIGVLVFSVTLSFTAQISEIAVWVCSIGLGLSYAMILALFIAWCSNYIAVDERFTGCFWGGFFIGSMTLPVVTTILLNNVYGMWFAYVVAASAVGLSTCFLCLILVFKKMERKDQQLDAINENIDDGVDNPVYVISEKVDQVRKGSDCIDNTSFVDNKMNVYIYNTRM